MWVAFIVGCIVGWVLNSLLRWVYPTRHDEEFERYLRREYGAKEK
jgi:hypothetical protein